VTRPDFEVRASVRARRLKANVPWSGSLIPETHEVQLDRRQSRVNLPRELDAGETYEHILIQHQVIGRLAHLLSNEHR
jgi:hypothetical protein